MIFPFFSVIIVVNNMGIPEEGGERNLLYFQHQKLPCLRTFLQERGIQTCSEGKGKRKAELVELAFNAHLMKLARVSVGARDRMYSFVISFV